MTKLKKAISLVLAIALLAGTVACLGGVVGIKAKAEVPEKTDNLDGITRTPGQHGRSVPLNEENPEAETDLQRLYPDGYIYLSGTVYEFNEGCTPDYDFMNNTTVTDGYVQPGDYVVLVVKCLTSQAAIYSSTYWFAHSLDFFEVPFDNANDPIPLEPMNPSNKNLETKGVIMNFANKDVDTTRDNAYGLSFKATTNNNSIYSEAGQAQLCTNSGYDATQLESIGCSRFISNKSGSATVIAGEDDNWTLAVLYKVRETIPDPEDPEKEIPMPEGKMGSIYIPYADNTQSLWKYPGMSAQVAGPKQANIITKATSATGANVQLNKFTGTFDFSDFGATLCIGEPPAGPGGVETYTATFYDADGTTPLGTVENIISGKSINAIDSPADTEGRYFKGWTTVLGEESAIVTFPQTITGNVEYYAYYSEVSPVTLVFGDTEIRAFNGDVIDSFPAAAPVEGKDFKGWSTVNDDASKIVTPPYTVNTAESTVTFYPIYETKVFTVTFDANGGNEEGFTAPVEYGQSINEPDATFTKKGYEFKGWSLSKTATAPDFGFGSTPIKSDTTLYAVWVAKIYYIKIYLTEDASAPYKTIEVTYNTNLPTLVAADKPSAQANAPGNSAFAGWFNKESGNSVSAVENKPAGTSGRYAYDSDLEVYAAWTEASTFSFYIPSVENEGEWVLVGTYANVTSGTWGTIKDALDTKSSALGYKYETEGNGAIARSYLAKWYTNEEGTEGVVTLDGKDANNNVVVTVNDPVTNTAYYIGGKRISDTDVLASEGGESLLDSTQAKNQYEGNKISVPLSRIEAAAPEGEEFAGYFVDEEGNEIETTLTTSNATFTLVYGAHTYYPAYKDIVYTIIFTIDSNIATAEIKYGETLTVDSEAITPYSPYTTFPEVPENIPDIDADPSLSEQLYDKTLKDWGKDGYIITRWDVMYSGQAVATLDKDNPYAVNPDHSYISKAQDEFEGKHIIKVNAAIKPLYYEATFSCADAGAVFPDGETEHKLWIATGTSADSIRGMAEEAFGVPTKENCTFISWQPNEAMGAEATTFTPMIYGKPVKIYFVYGDVGEEGLDYEALYNGEYTDCFVLNKYCEQDGSDLAEEGQSMVEPYSWAPYSLLMGWSIAPAYTFTNENDEEIEFVDSLGDHGQITGYMAYTTNYKPFEDCWLILYDSGTSYLIGSILEGIIDKERAINELFNFSDEPAAPGKIEELVGDYTGRTIEQVLSEELQKSFNGNIYKTVDKKGLKTTYWHEGKQVSKKEAAINLNAEEDVVIWYQFKLINFNIKKLFSPEMWKHVYIAGRPVVIPKSWLDPSQTAQTLETIINVVKGLMG